MVARLTGAMELLRTSVWISAFVIVASGSLLAETPRLQSRAKRYALSKDPHLNPLPCRERGNRYSIFEPPAVPLVGPAP